MYEGILWHKIPRIKSRIDRVKQTLQPAGGYWPLPLSESQGPFLPSWVSLSSFRPLALPIRFLLFLFSPFSSHDCSTAVQPMPATCLLSADRFLPVPRTIYFPRVPTIYDSLPFLSRAALLAFFPHNPFSQYPPRPLVLVLFFVPSRRPCRPDRVTSFFGRFFRTRNNAPVPGSIPRVHEWTRPNRTEESPARLTFARVDSATTARMTTTAATTAFDLASSTISDTRSTSWLPRHFRLGIGEGKL